MRFKAAKTPNSERPAGARNKTFRANLERRRSEAHTRLMERNLRTAAEQLERLDRLLGKGKGAVRERARLQEIVGAS